MFIMNVAPPPHLSCHITPLVAIAGYLAYPKQLRINPTLLYFLSVIHNSLLLVFSAWTFVSLSQILYNDGIVFQSNYYFQNQHFDTVIYWFYISKYYEFFDTFLLYLNGKSPIFLQKYHHVGAVLGWHLAYYYKVDGTILTTIMNSFVHTIMYSYYLGCLLKIKQVRFIKKNITQLQLSQFFIGLFLLYIYFPPIETYNKYWLIVICQVYNIGLIVCFIEFYNRNYIEHKTK